jgi:glycosyltransferase involved in cell wall biosynthesis
MVIADGIFVRKPNNQLKILILAHRVPFPQNGGYPIVVYNTIKGLVNLGHDVSLVALNSKKNFHEVPEDALLDKIKYRAYDIDTNVSVFDVAINLFSKTSFNIDKYYDPEFEKLLIREVKGNAYDVIQFDGLLISLYLNAVRKNCKSKLIYRAHNIEHQVWQRLAMVKSDPFKKSYLKMHAQRIKNYELEQLNKFDSVVVFTEQDKATMIGYGIKAPIDIVPVGVNLEQYRPDYSKTEVPSLFFLGSLDWLPNREGIEWFLENFHKDIESGDLPVKFYVAGNDIPERFDDYEVMGKIFIPGEVDDALEFVNSKSIMIVPLLSSGGVRVKIVEGMAMEKCIISTSLGAEGIKFTDGENILIANSYDMFYDAIQRCVADEKYCRYIGLNARKLIEQQHDISVVTDKLVILYNKLLKS